MESLVELDKYLFHLINSIGWEKMDEVMILISSKWFWIPLYVYILYLIFLKFSNGFLKIIISIGLLVFISDFGSVHLFKEIFERLRPCYELNAIRVVDGCGGEYGFISSHASNSFSIGRILKL